jgi:putative phosphoserine phosphatase/1-acylglycerol-3-phosphate O-acyltransferase
MQYQLERVAQELDVEHLICTRLEVKGGRLSGGLEGPACYGEEKCRAALRFAQQRGVDLRRSWFYTDGAEDVPLLEAVGKPRPINPDEKLGGLARERGWPVRVFQSRGIPGLADIFRTGLVYGSLVPSMLLGAPAWLFNRSRRDAINLGISLWGDFGSAIAGLELKVRGEKHLWANRPAVFIFNHQSAADALVVAHLLRKDFTGLAKKELRNNPLLAGALSFADVVFIDRTDKGNATINSQAALDKLAQGLSLAVAPEGQRSLAYRLGPFKKGAFHIAMQAGVPIIPIVIANTSDALPKSSICIRPAKVNVTVLPPIPTHDWSAGTMDEHVRHCRELFLRELGQSGP